MNDHIILALLLPLLTGVMTLLAGKRQRLARITAFIGSSLSLSYALYLLWLVWDQGIQVSHLGGWPVPFGIVLTVDLLSAIMLGISTLMGWVVLLYTFATIDDARERFGFYPLYQFLLLGVSGAFLAGDLFNLYVWFEVMLISSFGLMTLGGERDQLEGGLKYVVINLVSSTFFLIAVGLLYGATGTLNMAQMAGVLGSSETSRLIPAVAMLFLLTFGIKAAIFPLFYWLPASYHTPPVAVTALFGGLLTKVGVYAMYRVFTLLFVDTPPLIHDLLLVLAGATMLVGVLGAIAQNNVRRILSFHIISQIGYMIMGLGLFSIAGLTGGVFYIVHHIIVKTALLMIGGAVEELEGSGDLKVMGGQLNERPMLAVLFLIAALSLAGIPPFSGFFSKLTLLSSALEQEEYAIAAVSLIVSLLTLFSMTKIWNQVFWKKRPEGAPVENGTATQSLWRLAAPAALLVVLTVSMGLGAGQVLAVSDAAASQLFAPETYIRAVLGVP
ncbi:MAG TPA: Na+/H+ antiporter subunit D [Candidatus Sulfomarinibacteraceae bacterium]|nr:Na+/H+ antiporter subunit D [Candidatus Sulfomarinibacteraceae bacterium]